MLDLRFHRLARAELADAADWYESRRTGGRAKFLADARTTLLLIREIPGVGSAFETGAISVRRAVIVGWPYWFVYVVHDNEVRVLAVAHMKRRPTYWSRREAVTER
jgi:plasmid stabilization system protein ParE